MKRSAKRVVAATAVVVMAGAAACAWFVLSRRPPEGPSPPPPTPNQNMDRPARVTPLAGDGRIGARDGAASQAQFADPYGLAWDPHGTLYVSDGGDNDRIRVLHADGSVATLAGGVEGFQDGQGAAARFNTPSGLALDALGNLYVADTGNHAIRKVTPAGVVTTLAGTGRPGYGDGPGAQAQFDGPMGLAIDAAGRVIVADAYNDRIRAIAPDGTVTTLAGGNGPGDVDGAGAQARFDTPCAVLVEPGGRILVADTRNDALREIDATGSVTTLAQAQPGNNFELLRRPASLARKQDGLLVIGTLAGELLEISPRVPSVLLPVFDAGVRGFVRPTGLAVGSGQRLLVADSASSRLHVVVNAPSNGQTHVDGGVGPAPDRALPAAQHRWPLRPQLAWHEVVGTIGEDRGDGKGESRDHFHDGLDVRGDIGQEVLAIAPGKVSNPISTFGFGKINEGLSIGELGYIHMHVGRGAQGVPLDPARFVPVLDDAGKLQRVRVRRGTRFAAGEVLGTINPMAHVHLRLGVSDDGLNPLLLEPHDFVDTVPPSVASVEMRDAAGARLARRQANRLVVPQGDGAVVVDAFDQVDGNLPRRRLGLYSLGFQWLHADGTPVTGFETPRTAIEFARLPPDDQVKTVYAERSGITVQGNAETHFRYAIAHPLSVCDPVATGCVPTWLPAGDYVLRIVAKDLSGNEAMRGRDLAVRVVTETAGDPARP